MNYLELCQNVRRESRVTGSGPASVKNQRGILEDIVQATRNAWVEIQSLHPDWKFLEKTVSSPLILGRVDQPFNGLGVTEYASLKQVLLDGCPMNKVSWDTLLTRQATQDVQDGQPSVYALPPEGDRLMLDTKPNSLQTLTIQYYRQPVLLKENGDQANIQEHLQWAIVWRATADIAVSESDSALYQKAYEKFDAALALMFGRYLPEITLGRWS